MVSRKLVIPVLVVFAGAVYLAISLVQAITQSVAFNPFR